MPELPTITPELPGIGGEIKIEPEHFIVEEVALYPPAGEGDHLFVRFTREGQTTREVVENLARALDIPPNGIGYAGLKDKHARELFDIAFPPEQPDAKDVKWKRLTRGVGAWGVKRVEFQNGCYFLFAVRKGFRVFRDCLGGEFEH